MIKFHYTQAIFAITILCFFISFNYRWRFLHTTGNGLAQNPRCVTKCAPTLILRHSRCARHRNNVEREIEIQLHARSGERTFGHPLRSFSTSASCACLLHHAVSISFLFFFRIPSLRAGFLRRARENERAVRSTSTRRVTRRSYVTTIISELSGV